MSRVPRCRSRPLNLSAALLAKRFDSGSWSVARMCTAKCEPSVKACADEEFLLMLHSTIGGSIDTELKLLAVKP
ncbi:hypothetical protein D9M72_632940 [compost metagenome]